MLDSVSNNNIYRKNSNIKFEGYLKNRKKLIRDFLVADFKYKNSQTFENNSSLLDSHKKLVKFFNENPLRTFLFNLFDRITSTKSKKNFKNQEPSFLREQVAKVKQQFQNLRFNFNGESFTIIDFINKSDNTKDIYQKELLTKEYSKKISLLENDIRNLIIARNTYAKAQGFNNYYEYILKTIHKINQDKIDSYKEKFLSSYNIPEFLNKRNKIIAEYYNIQIDEIKQNHEKKLCSLLDINKYFKSSKDIIEIGKSFYNSIGIDIDKLEKEGKIIYNFAKGRNSNANCKNVIPGEVTYIDIPLLEDIKTLSVFIHETAHAIHLLGASKFLPVLYKNPSYQMGETVALLLESLIYKENFLEKYVPKKELDKYKEARKIDREMAILRTIVNMDFEKSLYENPNQDFMSLYKSIYEKYFGESHDNLDWFVPHYIYSPGYLYSYLSGFLSSENLYEKTKKQLGTELSNNPKTLEFLQNKIFKFGKIMNEDLLETVLKI